MANPIDWTLYRTFLGVLREGSLSGAARTLGITQPTAGRHVAALERALRVVLFTRSPSGLQPTEAALALQPLVKAMADTAAALERAASARGEGGDDALRGVVRITASDVIGLEVLPPVLARLRERHRALVLELALTDRVEDLLHGEADIAVRMVRPGQERLIARRIGEVELGMHASRGYIARHGAPGDVQELLGPVHPAMVPAPGSDGSPDEAPATRVAVPRKESATKYGSPPDPGPKGEREKSTHSALQMLAVAPPRLCFAP
ncbi:MAG: LysR family transcriptional regulator [Burkholderiaceae bacterium]|nr:LysR family transcriptional regulator [Burkholderiaceae bacterium]